MKRLFLGCILSVFLFSSSYGFGSFTEESCFREVAVLPANTLSGNSLLFGVPHKDILVKQSEKILPVSMGNNPYISFSTNLSQLLEKTDSLGQIDTQETQEILITLDENVKKENFSFIFNYDSNYYTPKYSLSEDNEQSYFQVLKNDISEYAPTHIKVRFIPKGEDTIREIIDIRSIIIKDSNTLFLVKNINPEKDIKIFGNNSCGQTRDAIDIFSGDTRQQTIYPNFIENISYNLNNIDSDNDGVTDLYDNCKTVKNTSQKDINQNGVGDACEFDSDNDSIPDEIDNCRNIANANQEDSDNDGIGNLCDNCDYYNPSQSDSDENGIGDVCDERKKYIQENDDDNDGVANSTDNCKTLANPDQADDDGDGVGNICDNCVSFQNFNQLDFNKNGIGDICEDSDNDGIDGITDNCINVANPEQADSDNDGVGNLCEDDDGDRVIFSQDNCPYTYNPGQEDFDKDGYGDVCDESDDRLLEANKGVFIALMLLITLLFLGGIYTMNRKLKQ